jgi:two-component system, cell cycle response regulator DivK
VITVTVPNQSVAQPEGEKVPPVAKILLVEDNEMNRDMLSRRLQRKGYEVVIAEDGRQGVDLARKETPDVILLDMSLPVVDGWQAAREIRAQAETRRTPIIALTAHAMSGDREKALAAGCDDYDTKPVEMPRLLAKIAALLARQP